MSKKKAVVETIIVSLMIPLMIFLYVLYNSKIINLFLIAFWIIVPLAYTLIVFYRHKKCGKSFVLLSALLSSIFQGIILYCLLKIYFSYFAYPDVHKTGHPNGDAVGAFLLLFFEPVLINLPAFAFWIIRKIIVFLKNLPDE